MKPLVDVGLYVVLILVMIYTLILLDNLISVK